MKIGIVSLGCCKNLVDSENCMTFLKAAGHTFTDNPRQAEVIVVNTCGFINDAKQESIDTILQMADYKNDNCKYLIVMGCLVQRYRKELEEELPEVDLFISIDEYKNLETILNDFLGSKTIKPYDVVLATSEFSTYLRIADGCSNKCAYCAIPLIRKDYKSVPMEEILQQAKKLQDIGVKELNVIAQDTTRYGKDIYDRYALGELLSELDKMDFKWIRVLYMYPDEITDELLDTMSKLKNVVPYFDIPVQHGNDRLLSLMNRRGNKQHILNTIKKIREKFDEPILRTTYIVGFPTETGEEFEELLQFTEQVNWDRMGAFAYSLEEDTTSFDMEPKVDEDVAQNRLQRLMELQERISFNNNQKYIGKTIEVLVETKDGVRANLYQGRSWMSAPDEIDPHIRFTSDREIKPGEFVMVKVTSAKAYDLAGEVVE